MPLYCPKCNRFVYIWEHCGSGICPICQSQLVTYKSYSRENIPASLSEWREWAKKMGKTL